MSIKPKSEPKSMLIYFHPILLHLLLNHNRIVAELSPSETFLVRGSVTRSAEHCIENLYVLEIKQFDLFLIRLPEFH